MQIAHHWSADGFVATRYQDDEDAHLVAILRDLGAVFYCKTNQPQAIMHLETISPYGRTLNPHNINLSAGGSSGGEAALIALRGSILGMYVPLFSSSAEGRHYHEIFVIPSDGFMLVHFTVAAEIS